MKKYIICVSAAVLFFLLCYTLYYEFGVYLPFLKKTETDVFVKTDNKQILLDRGNGFQPFEIHGVDMGSGMPGKWSTDYGVDYDSYYRWFGLIQDMGANTVRVYSVQQDIFYNAFYDYNNARKKEGHEPLYLLQGVWVSNYAQFSHNDFYSDELMKVFIHDCKCMIDVIHGKRNVSLGRMAASGSGVYRKNISEWVIGYILGVEWESDLVIYTNQKQEDKAAYYGKYLQTSDDANAFEAGLARVGDEVITYETERYGAQRILSFTNWPETDPFKYSTAVTSYWKKLASVDLEHIKKTNEFSAGLFASYHVYPYFPDYLQSEEKEKQIIAEERTEMEELTSYRKLEYMLSKWNAPKISDYLSDGDYIDRQGRFNTYRAYLSALNRYHTIPVIISEFGLPSGRGVAHIDENTGRNQGHLTEQEQGKAIVECYHDIRDAGISNCCLFSWQDEWFKRTWNTLYAVDMRRNPYWSDYQTNEQYFGVMAFDPGKDSSVCYVDGDISEWENETSVIENDEFSLCYKYDERYIYFLIENKDSESSGKPVSLVLDVTPESGSNYCANNGLQFDCDADFLVLIDGGEKSEILVQSRYEALRSTYAEPVYGFNTYYKRNIPEKNSSEFVPINMILKTDKDLFVPASRKGEIPGEVFPTGKLRMGNGNPNSPEFDSLADYMKAGNHIELRIPWGLLNFADPSRMEIHSDYYVHYGVDYTHIKSIRAGVAYSDDTNRVSTQTLPLHSWGNRVSYHERLKSGYYQLQREWKNK